MREHKFINFSVNSTGSPKNYFSLPGYDDSADSTIAITFIGDLMCHSPQFINAYIDSSDSYDFRNSFTYIKSILSESELTIGNFETVVSGKSRKYSGYPLFNSPDEYLSGIKWAGFNILNLANNHILDGGTEGVLRTINIIDSLNINRIGAYSSSKDRDSIRIFNCKGILIAILAYTEFINIPYKQNENYQINMINPEVIANDIIKAKESAADIIIVYLHSGIEYKRTPSRYQTSVFDTIIASGADFVISSHPHVLQPFVLKKSHHSSKIDSSLIAYSLGNFISNQDGWIKQEGAVLKILITKGKDNSVKLKEIHIHPTYCFKGRHNEKPSHIVIPVKNYSLDSLKQLGFLITKTDSVNISKILNDTIFNVMKTQ